jgi:DNA-binding NarL/FixJ family response regulator
MLSSRNDLHFTAREIEVLKALAEGCSSKEAAKRLNVAPRTIESHVERLRLKTNAHNRAGVLMVALSRGAIHAG